MARAHPDDTPPSNLDVDNGAAITTAVSVTVASNRTLHAWWFWVPTTNSGTYTLELWDITGDDDPGPAAGTLLLSQEVAAAAVTAGRYNRVNMDTPQAVVTTKVYRAARHASSGRYVSTPLAFNGAQISNNGITLIQSGTNPGALFPGVLRNGTFREGAAGVYPGASFNASDYHIDVDDAAEVSDDVTGVLAATTSPPIGAFTGTVINPVTGTLAAVTSSPVAALSGAVVSGTPPTWPAGVLLDVQRENYESAKAESARGPLDCPSCGWPLEYRGGVANCPAGDYRSR